MFGTARSLTAGRSFPSAPARSRLSWPLHPSFRRLAPPLIVVGMHGSGTSVVSQILTELGVHMGSRLDSHFEAHEFWELNEEVLYRAGASWHRPEALAQRLDSPAFRATVCARFSQATFGSLQRFLDGAALPSGAAWGWKDPRTSLTLPLWLQLFPEARVIHVSREAEASARSIHRRACREAEAGGPASGAGIGSRARALRRALLSPEAALRTVGRRLRMSPPVPAGDPCLSLEHCRSVAEHYVESCHRWRGLAADWIELPYEELLREPERQVAALAWFVGQARERPHLQSAAALVRRPAV